MLGDPVELQALGGALGKRNRAQRFAAGALKAAIGHAEAAAGVAGIIKTLLCFEHEEITPNKHLTTLNPHIDMDRIPIVAPRDKTRWPRGDQPRVAGVSSFGFSGTNAHVILQEPPFRPSQGKRSRADCSHVLTISARTEAALNALCSRYRDYLSGEESEPIGDIAFTTNVGRVHFAKRLAIVSNSHETAREALEATLRGEPHSAVFKADTFVRQRVSFLFGEQLLFDAPVLVSTYALNARFRAAVDRCCCFMPPSSASIVKACFEDTNAINSNRGQVDHQPSANLLVFATQYGLADLWSSWGVLPTGLTGFGIGELVALCVGGMCSLERAISIVSTEELPAVAGIPKTVAPKDHLPVFLSHLSRQAEVNDPETIKQVPVVPKSLTNALQWSAGICTTMLTFGTLKLKKHAFEDLGSVSKDFADLWAKRLDAGQIARSVAQLYSRGYPLDWKAFHSGLTKRRILLPTYPFQRKRYWIDRVRRNRSKGDKYTRFWEEGFNPRARRRYLKHL